MKRHCSFPVYLESMEHAMWDHLHASINLGNDLMAVFHRQAVRLELSGCAGVIKYAMCLNKCGFLARGRQVIKNFNDFEQSTHRKASTSAADRGAKADKIAQQYFKGPWKRCEIDEELRNLWELQGLTTETIDKKIRACKNRDMATSEAVVEMTGALLRGDVLEAHLNVKRRLQADSTTLGKQVQEWAKSRASDSAFSEQDVKTMIGANIDFMGWEIRLIAKSARTFATVLSENTSRLAGSLQSHVDLLASQTASALNRYEMAMRAAATTAEALHSEAAKAFQNLSEAGSGDDSLAEVAQRAQRAQEASAEAWETYACAAADHAVVHAEHAKITSGDVALELDETMRAAVEGWTLFDKMLAIDPIPDDLDAWQHTAQCFKEWYHENIPGESGGVYLHIYADGHADERMMWLQKRFAASGRHKLSLPFFTLQSFEHLNKAVKTRLSPLYFLMSKEKNAFDLIISDKLLQLTEFMDTVPESGHRRCTTCLQLGHYANNRDVHPIRGDRLIIEMKSEEPVKVLPSFADVVMTKVAQLLKLSGEDRFGVQAAVSVTQGELVDDANDGMVEVQLSTPTNCSISHAACCRLAEAVHGGKLAVIGQTSDRRGFQFAATRFRLKDFRDTYRFDSNTFLDKHDPE
eukprot:m.373732 g.373732  ORF g.373732 m.373732 type:complete len:636 (-) comp16691_c3_seq2:7-1914(-)